MAALEYSLAQLLDSNPRHPQMTERVAAIQSIYQTAHIQLVLQSLIENAIALNYRMEMLMQLVPAKHCTPTKAQDQVNIIMTIFAIFTAK